MTRSPTEPSLQSSSDPGAAPASRRTPTRRLARFVAIVLAAIIHAALGVAVSVSGLVMPRGAVALLALFWLGGVVAIVLSRARPALLLAIPVVSWGVWFAVLWLGDALLGWTA